MWTAFFWIVATHSLVGGSNISEDGNNISGDVFLKMMESSYKIT
jgi:hypothetical protein